MTNNYNNHEEENFLFDKNKKNPFGMPQGYFDSFANKMNHKIELEKELEEFKILASIQKENVFSFPVNYFSENEKILEQAYEVQAYPALNKITKPELKTISAEYLKASESKIMMGIEVAEEIKRYATLYSIEKQNNFNVVPEYFDTLAQRVKNKYYNEQKTKVSIVDIIFSYLLKPRVVFAYSTVLVVAVALFIYLNKETNINSGDCQTLACLEKRELLNEKNVTDFSDEDLYEMVDVEELDKQLMGEEIATDDSITSTNIK